VYSVDKLVRKWHCVQHPTQLDFIPEKNLLTIVEHNHISLWDVRSASPQQRVYLPSNEPLYGLSCLSEVIGVGGAARILSIFDTHTWKVRSHWRNCVKYEITSVNFSSKYKEFCYVSDDSVIVCDEWTAPNKNSRHYFSGGVRLESSLVGVSKDSNDDIVACLTENGILTVIVNGVQDVLQRRQIAEKPQSSCDNMTTQPDSLGESNSDFVEQKRKKQKTS